VSTDEQADKGYSLQHQEERLRNYCQLNDIEIVQLFKEDYSAKTFNRPAFNKLVEFLKKNKNSTNLLLFLKWDRFSRNAGEAYEMINRLYKMGVEPQGIEQPLDLNVPENKLMLAFFLAAPEVENDRRALNVIAGMRRAKKDGRLSGIAPYGYKNERDVANKPIIIPNDDAKNVKWIFEECAKGLCKVHELWDMAKKRNFKGSINGFWYLLRNPVYCGNLFLPAYKDEHEMIIKGKHEPIISEELFNEVQDLLNGRKRVVKSKYSADENIPLRGFLICKECGKPLTGSRSKGRNNYYYYYHCKEGCKERYKSEDVNNALLKTLSEIKANTSVLELYKHILFDVIKKKNSNPPIEKEQLTQQINKYEKRLKNAQEDWLDRKISVEDYSVIKKDIENKLNELRQEKEQLSGLESEGKMKLNQTLPILRNLDKHYLSADLETKLLIIGSTYPEKTIYSENQLSNRKINPAITFITATSKEMQVG
jgi:DNA invertase Pin-like site-specific DNA recombinase